LLFFSANLMLYRLTFKVASVFPRLCGVESTCCLIEILLQPKADLDPSYDVELKFSVVNGGSDQFLWWAIGYACRQLKPKLR
jgi:hypothetical protein